jgi:methyltransferase
MVTKIFFLVLLAALAAQRLVELRRSRRNESAMRKQGGREHVPEQVPWMKALHSAWFVSMGLELWLLDPPWNPWVAAVALIGAVTGQWLRYEAMRSLGSRWSVRVFTLPGEPPVSDGIFRLVRHPNYFGVVLELAAVPLIHGAVLTSLLFTVGNLVFLSVRIPAEEQALRDSLEEVSYGNS